MGGVHAFALGILREVGSEGFDAHLPRRAEPVRRGSERRGIARDEHEVAALGGEGLCAGQADALRSAGDKHPLALKLHVHVAFSPLSCRQHPARAGRCKGGDSGRRIGP